jgi:hypothetical protein
MLKVILPIYALLFYGIGFIWRSFQTWPKYAKTLSLLNYSGKSRSPIRFSGPGRMQFYSNAEVASGTGAPQVDLPA